MSSKNGTNIGLDNINTVFVTNRGGTHPNRLLYFDSINADYQYVDFKLRWHGLNRPKYIMILSGFVCALLFPKRQKYKLFVTSDPQLPVVLMKKLGLLKSSQRIASYLGSQTLYFMYSKYYSRFTIHFYRFLLRSYDFHICNGALQAKFLKEVAKINDERIFINFNGINESRASSLKKIKYNANSETILFIGNIYSNWRIHYKGLDIAIEAFSLLIAKRPSLKFIIVGNYDHHLTNLILSKIPSEHRNKIVLTGNVKDFSNLLLDCSLYIHCSRGDALPNSLIEVLYAGVPSIVSNITGNHEIIHQIDPKLVVNIDKHQLRSSIEYFMDLPTDVKKKYSKKAKSLTKDLTQTSAVAKFQEIIKNIGSN